jgi:hypothetical protein
MEGGSQPHLLLVARLFDAERRGVKGLGEGHTSGTCGGCDAGSRGLLRWGWTDSDAAWLKHMGLLTSARLHRRQVGLEQCGGSVAGVGALACGAATRGLLVGLLPHPSVYLLRNRPGATPVLVSDRL